jgi:uncharacterized cupin superfamily protein
MPKIDIAKAPLRTTTTYPDQFKGPCVGREKQAISNVAGLTQFGVNITRLKPGAASALRHWHEQEDEFIYMLEGELTLIEDDGETVLKPGDAAGFKAGVANGHHLVNRSSRDAVFLEVGTRSVNERGHYPDVDLVMIRESGQFRFTNKAGKPYPPQS